MAQITLNYDARNTKAKLAIDFILSLGFFDVEKSDKKEGKLADFYSDFEKAVKEAKEISQGKRKGKLLEDVLNEIQ